VCAVCPRKEAKTTKVEVDFWSHEFALHASAGVRSTGKIDGGYE
jgi:hypothetical protein